MDQLGATVPAVERRDREFQRREQEILDAALALFDREDWQAVTIDEIAARAEIGKGTVYKHFTSKDELHAALAERFHRRILARLEEIGSGGTPPEQLTRLVRIVWDEYRDLPPALQRVVERCGRAELPEFADAASRILAAGVADGWFARRPLPRMLFLVRATLAGALRLRSTGCVSPGEDTEYRDGLILFLLNGLAEGL